MKSKTKKNIEKAARSLLAVLNGDQLAGQETGVAVEARTQLVKFCDSYEEALQRVDQLEQELHIRKADARVQKQNLKESYKAVKKSLKKNLPKKMLKQLDAD